MMNVIANALVTACPMGGISLTSSVGQRRVHAIKANKVKRKAQKAARKLNRKK